MASDVYLTQPSLLWMHGSLKLVTLLLAHCFGTLLSGSASSKPVLMHVESYEQIISALELEAVDSSVHKSNNSRRG